SCLASEGDGGPCGRRWRNGRSPRSVLIPDAANLSASASSSGALQLPPAPWVSTMKLAPESFARCKNPRTGDSPGASLANGSAARLITVNQVLFYKADLPLNRNKPPRVVPFATDGKMAAAHHKKSPDLAQTGLARGTPC